MKKNPAHPVHPVKNKNPMKKKTKPSEIRVDSRPLAVKNPHAVALGRLGGLIGGKATGKCKARTPAQARAAALVMWAKRRAATNVPHSSRRSPAKPESTKGN